MPEQNSTPRASTSFEFVPQAFVAELRGADVTVAVGPKLERNKAQLTLEPPDIFSVETTAERVVHVSHQEGQRGGKVRLEISAGGVALLATRIVNEEGSIHVGGLPNFRGLPHVPLRVGTIVLTSSGYGKIAVEYVSGFGLAILRQPDSPSNITIGPQANVCLLDIPYGTRRLGH